MPASHTTPNTLALATDNNLYPRTRNANRQFPEKRELLLPRCSFLRRLAQEAPPAAAFPCKIPAKSNFSTFPRKAPPTRQPLPAICIFLAYEFAAGARERNAPSSSGETTHPRSTEARREGHWKSTRRITVVKVEELPPRRTSGNDETGKIRSNEGRYDAGANPTRTNELSDHRRTTGTVIRLSLVRIRAI